MNVTEALGTSTGTLTLSEHGFEANTLRRNGQSGTLSIPFSDIEYCSFVDATPPNDHYPYKIIGGRVKEPGGLGHSLWVLIQKKGESMYRGYVVQSRSEFLQAADAYGKRCDQPNGQ